MLVCEKTWQGFAWSSLTLTFFGLLREYLFKGRWSLVNVYESFLKQNYCHANSLLISGHQPSCKCRMLKIVNSQFFLSTYRSAWSSQLSSSISLCLISLDSLIRFCLGVTCATSFFIRLLMHVIVINIIIIIITIPIGIPTFGMYM